MVYLKTKQIKGLPYYYLAHSVRSGNKHFKKEKYIGREKPGSEELEHMKRRFLASLTAENWLCLTDNDFEIIENIKDHLPELYEEEKLMDFCINFTYNTNAIENSPLSKDDTVKLLKHDVSVNKSFKDEIESFSHKRVFMGMINTTKPLTLSLLKHWHKEIFSQSKPDLAGKYRDVNVRVAGFKAPHFMDIGYLLEEFLQWYESNKKTMHPIELAAMAHLKFVKVHPFLDGNGRIARLLLNYVLSHNGYPMMTVEYKNRMSYYKALDEFDETQEEEVFVKFIIDSYIDEYSLIA